MYGRRCGMIRFFTRAQTTRAPVVKAPMAHADKQRLIDACLRPCASLLGLTLKSGANANQLHQRVWLREQSNTPVRNDVAVAWSALMPVIVVDDAAAVLVSSPAARPVSVPEPSRLSPQSETPARLSGQSPNDVTLELAGVPVLGHLERPCKSNRRFAT